MEIIFYRDVICCVCEFDKNYYLSTKFTGNGIINALYNRPIDFYQTALLKKDRADIYAQDVILSTTTDEATPIEVNGEHIGANHGEPVLIEVVPQIMDKLCLDIGSVWQDLDGDRFTLLRVEADRMFFVSDNIGESDLRYAFKKKINGCLTHVSGAENTAQINIEKQRLKFLAPALRHICRQVNAVVGGVVKPAIDVSTADSCEIIDEYYIINPATVASAVIAGKPIGGYSENPELSKYGEPMVHYKVTYRILSDGTVLSEVDIKRLSGVLWHRCMGHMCQDRCNAYFGGVYRIMPKILPIVTDGVTYDFSVPLRVDVGGYPHEVDLTPDLWLDKNSPPDKMVDIMRDNGGKAVLAFAAGYLPLFDAEKSVRRGVCEAGKLFATRKFYPTLKTGDISSAKAVAYKKYFRPVSDALLTYSIEYGGKKYRYFDFLGKDCYVLKYSGSIRIYECYGDIELIEGKDTLTLSGTHGTALIIEDL